MWYKYISPFVCSFSLVVEHSLCKRKVGGSIPPVGSPFFIEPGLEPGLQGSEPWVLTNYTIEPLVRQWCIGNIEASQALAPGSTPGWRKLLLFFGVGDGGVAQMVERVLCMHEAQGSIPCSSTLLFFACFTQRVAVMGR